jgi:surface polysaccharide O-acyltransferase-like enzyme
MQRQSQQPSFWYRNGLTLFFLILFIITLVAQALTGWKENNQQLQDIGGVPLGLAQYLKSGHFVSATFENFQSEFLQMGMYVLLTVSLRQVGSAESKSLNEPEEVDREPKPSPEAPWPVKKGGIWLKLYSNSLSLCFLILFLISWGLHLYGSWVDHNDQQVLMHKPQDSIMHFLGEPTFWFETFQNWQSEFISIVSIVFLTIYLRQKGSSESKPVDAPHMETGK